MPTKKKAAEPRLKTRGERVISFIEKYCKAPEGTHVGNPIVLEDFQKKFILDVYDNPHGTHTGILSIGRKNGKSALIAGLLLAHIAGPEAVRNSQIVSGARSKKQAAIIFKLARKMIEMEPELAAVIRIFPSEKMLLGLNRNVEYQALAAEGSTTQGLSPILAIIDEMGQVKGPTDDFVEAVETAQGAYENPLYLVISTQAPTANDMFSRMIDAQLDDPDPKVVCHVYAAPDDCALDDENAWRAANPALGKFRSIEDLKKSIVKAQKMPSRESSVRNLILNQRVDSTSRFVPRSIWEANGADPGDARGKKVWCGLDLSSVDDLTALVAVDEDGGVHPTFWLPEFGLREKSAQDKVEYDVWRDRGLLLTTPGRSVQYENVAIYLREFFNKYDVQVVSFDRWSIKHLIPWLVKAGFSEYELTKFVEFGQGYASMTPALRDLEVKLLECELKHGKHPVLNMCASNAIVEGEAGARKFVKHKSRGRIDGMVALAMAIGSMPQRTEESKRTWDDYLADMAGA